MHQLAARELILFSLGAVAVVLVLSPLARSAQAAEEKSTPLLQMWRACPRLLIRAMSIVRLERSISALPSAAL